MLFLVVFSLMAGCLNGDEPAAIPDAPSESPGILTENGTRLLRFSTWPTNAMAMEVRVHCDCPGENVLLGWTFSANWSARASDVDRPQQTDVRDEVEADFFAVLTMRENAEPKPSPVVAHVDILRSWIVGVGVPGAYTAMAGTGLLPSAEVSIPSGHPGSALASYRQDFPLTVEMDGNPLRLLFVATNGTGERTALDLDVTLEVPSTASVTFYSGSSRAFAFDEPLLGQAAAPSADLNYLARANVRVFGESSMVWQSTGPLLYTFLPWVKTGGVQDATYGIDAPDHSYRVRLNYTNGEGGYKCLDGCAGLGGTYSLNAGLAPPGRTRFMVEEARCATDSGCSGVMVGMDLGSLKPHSFAAP